METKVADLRSHEDCQARLGLTEEAVESYEKAYKAGKSLPALEVFEVDGELIVVDGFHRLEAAKRADVATLPVEIVGKGTMAEAEWEALGKNHNHGVRRTREDKRKAVQMALANEAAAKMSNRQLAKYIDVSHQFVNNERKMWDLCGNVASPEVRWARKLLEHQPLERWKWRCDEDVAVWDKQQASPPKEDEHAELAFSPEMQWMRMALVFNHARFNWELENGRPLWEYATNMTHVACVMARACGYDPDEWTWQRIKRGWSLDFVIPVDDLALWGKIEDEKRRELYRSCDLMEWDLFAPHRPVRLRSDFEQRCGSGCWCTGQPGQCQRWQKQNEGPHGLSGMPTDEEKRTPHEYAVKIVDGEPHAFINGEQLSPACESTKAAQDWVDWHSSARR